MGKGVRGRRGVKTAGTDTKVKLKTGTETVKFDKAKSAADRKSSAEKSKRISNASKTQRVSGRAKTRAKTQEKVHGRTDAAKLKSKAVGKRNVRYAAEAAATVAPGGAAASYAAKGKKVLKAAKYAKAASKGKSVIKGAARLAKTSAKKVAKQGIKKTAKTAAVAAAKTGKYVAKTKAQGAANTAITKAATRRT